MGLIKEITRMSRRDFKFVEEIPQQKIVCESIVLYPVSKSQYAGWSNFKIICVSNSQREYVKLAGNYDITILFKSIGKIKREAKGAEYMIDYLSKSKLIRIARADNRPVLVYPNEDNICLYAAEDDETL